METTQKARQIEVLETVLIELNSIKKGSKVYKQQPNSNIFFLADIDTLRVEKEKELKKLQVECENVEKGSH